MRRSDALGCTVLLLAGSLLAGRAMGQNPAGMAAGILAQTSQARQAIGMRDKPAALDHVQRAAALAIQIEQASAGQAKPILVEVSRETETTTTYTPVKHRKSDEMSADRMKKNTSIREVDAEETGSWLDVTNAARKLETAQAALEREDWAPADAALAAIESSVVERKTEGDRPIRMARQNLALARARLLENKPKDAVMPLQSAAEALGVFAKQSTGPRAAEAEAMRQQILAYARGVGHEHGDALERISGWRETLEQWDGASGSALPR